MHDEACHYTVESAASRTSIASRGFAPARRSPASWVIRARESSPLPGAHKQVHRGIPGKVGTPSGVSAEGSWRMLWIDEDQRIRDSVAREGGFVDPTANADKCRGSRVRRSHKHVLCFCCSLRLSLRPAAASAFAVGREEPIGRCAVRSGVRRPHTKRKQQDPNRPYRSQASLTPTAETPAHVDARRQQRACCQNSTIGADLPTQLGEDPQKRNS
jgi:hypothetical protein